MIGKMRFLPYHHDIAIPALLAQTSDYLRTSMTGTNNKGCFFHDGLPYFFAVSVTIIFE
jgi:hypothetical protein